MRTLRENHSDLWKELLKLEREPDKVGNIWNTRSKISVTEIEEMFYWESQQMRISDFFEID